MRHLVVLTFALVAASWIAISQGVSSRYGFKGLHDQLLYRTYIIKDYSWFRRVTADVEYPPPGFVNTKTISAIYVIDQTGGKNTTTGYGSLSSGGPGQTHAKVHIKAPYRAGLNFTVEIYGSSGYAPYYG